MEHGEQGWGELGAGAQGASGEEGRVQVQRPGTPGVRSEAWVPAQWLQEAEGRGQQRRRPWCGPAHQEVWRRWQGGWRRGVRKEAYVLQTTKRLLGSSMAAPQRGDHRITALGAACWDIPEGLDSGHVGTHSARTHPGQKGRQTPPSGRWVCRKVGFQGQYLHPSVSPGLMFPRLQTLLSWHRRGRRPSGTDGVKSQGLPGMRWQRAEF